MKIKNLCLAGAVLALGVSPMIASAQESENSLLSMTYIELKPLAGMSFGTAMSKYIDCYKENGGEDSWTAWRDTGSSTVWIVSSMDGWADMDQERSEANRACWPMLADKMPAHIDGITTDYARFMSDWSDPVDDFNVVRLHQFMVDENDDFQETVGDMTSMLMEADFEHMGVWYDMIGSDAGGIDYFQVSMYENFAAIDADRPNYNSVMVEEMGEEKAEEMWDELFDSLDDNGYKTVLLSRVEAWSYDADEE